MLGPNQYLNKFVEFTVTRGNPVNTPGDELAGQDPRHTVKVLDANPETVGGASGPPGRPIGRAPQPWTFKFLKWVPGRVTVTPLDGPVLSGPMSGCILFSYQQNGIQKLAHVGTEDNPQSAGTKEAKAAWKRIVAGLDEKILVEGYDPSSGVWFSFNELNKFAKAYSTNVDICGYFVGANVYAIAFAPVKQAARYCQVVGVKLIRPEPLDKLKKKFEA